MGRPQKSPDGLQLGERAIDFNTIFAGYRAQMKREILQEVWHELAQMFSPAKLTTTILTGRVTEKVAEDASVVFRCSKCPWTTTFRRAVGGHMAGHARKVKGKPQTTSFKCPDCPRRFSTPQGQWLHRQRAHGKLRENPRTRAQLDDYATYHQTRSEALKVLDPSHCHHCNRRDDFQRRIIPITKTDKKRSTKQIAEHIVQLGAKEARKKYAVMCLRCSRKRKVA